MAPHRGLRVLVATHVGQGLRSSDYCWAVEGELVLFGMECATDVYDIDGRCGCRRGMAGASSSKATTTFRVALVDMTHEEYRDAIRSSLERQGWISVGDDAGVPEAEDLVEGMVHELLETAREFPVGAILEKRGDLVGVRRLDASQSR